MEPVVIAAICTALGALVGAVATVTVGWFQSREGRREDRAAAALDQQWKNAHQASEWLVSENEAVRRLGVAQLLELEQFWGPQTHASGPSCTRLFALLTHRSQPRPPRCRSCCERPARHRRASTHLLASSLRRT